MEIMYLYEQKTGFADEKERDLVTSVRVGDQAQGKLATGV